MLVTSYFTKVVLFNVVNLIRFTNSLNLLPLSRNTLYIRFAHTSHMFTYTYFIHFRCVLQLMRLRIILLRVKFSSKVPVSLHLNERQFFQLLRLRPDCIENHWSRGRQVAHYDMENTAIRWPWQRQNLDPRRYRWYQEMTHLPVGCECSLRRIRRTNAKKRGAARATNNDTDDQYREEEGGGLGLGSPRPRFLFLEAKPNRKRAHQLFTPRSAHT